MNNENQQFKSQQQAISELEKKSAVTDVKLDHITQGITEIKTNHLVHINDQLSVMNALLNTKFEAVNSGFTEVYKQIAKINITDAKQEPGNKLFNKIIEYVILATVMAGIAFLVSRS